MVVIPRVTLVQLPKLVHTNSIVRNIEANPPHGWITHTCMQMIGCVVKSDSYINTQKNRQQKRCYFKQIHCERL